GRRPPVSGRLLCADCPLVAREAPRNRARTGGSRRVDGSGRRQIARQGARAAGAPPSRPRARRAGRARARTARAWPVEPHSQNAARIGRPMTGELAFVLHAHLPFIRHPEHRYHLEENWLYEAVTATYLPLLEIFRNLSRDRVPFRFSMSLSPP